VSLGQWRADIAAGYGLGRLLFLDASSGVAGDMTIAALVSLGVPWSVIEEAASALPISGFQLKLHSGRAGAIGASQFEVQISGVQEERHYNEIDDLIRRSSLAPGVKELSTRIFHKLALAEARVHHIPIERVHFHEVGAVDAIIDIVGAAAAFVHLQAHVVATPLPLGHGFVHCRHGVIPLPAPATVECLQGVPTYAAGIEAETVTPTGAAIVATVCQQFIRWPEMIPERTGWGAGTTSFPDRPNVLRAVLGMPIGSSQFANDGHAVLEANIDDMTGELTGYVMALLMQSGALDAWAAPITMKKGRPGVVLSAIVAPMDAPRLSELILRETTTLGVRRTLAERVERPRRIIEIQTRFGTVPVKVAEGPFGPVQFKPEFDACVLVAQQHQVPVREVIAEAMMCARGLFPSSTGH
jgi:uncharacterized protein (TIGR00299 family) protein